MPKIMVLGDTHGNRDATISAVNSAHMQGVTAIVQVGDFGLWDHFADGVIFLDTVNETLRRHGIRMFAIGGNHENWIRWNWYVENNDKDAWGFTYLRSNIRIAPKVHHWEMYGKQMACAGGAVSIDRDYRLKKEKSTGLGPNTMFWWDEQLLDADVMDYPETKVDYLFTHDCSNYTPFRDRMKPDFESQIHRQRIDAVLRKALPEMHFHGHMHTKYDWMNRVPDGDDGEQWVQTYGLECDGMFWNWGILDTETDEFRFRPMAPSLEPSNQSTAVVPFIPGD
jgi:hypothetical protein